MRRILLFSLICICQVAYSQEIVVKNMKETVSGTEAFRAPNDSLGHPSGLIKIQTMIQDLYFVGNVVGDYKYGNNEYLVYVAKGSKQFVIKHPNILPTVVNFTDYGIDEIASKATYIIELKTKSINTEKNGFVFNVKPKEAAVYVNDIRLDNIEGEGLYKIFIPKGEYICRFENIGYKTETLNVKTSRETQIVDVELESLMANLNIKCQSGEAQLLLDGKNIGQGGWQGRVLPGKHILNAIIEGYQTASIDVNLAEKENRTITIPRLKRICTSLVINTDPNGCMVMLDGNNMGATPSNIDDVEYGDHILRILLDSCGIKREKEINITVKDAETQRINCSLASKEEILLHQKATEWFNEAYYHISGPMPSDYSKQWYDKIITIIDELEPNFFCQQDIYEHMGYTSYYSFASTMIDYYLGMTDDMESPIKIINKVKGLMSMAAEKNAIGDAYNRAGKIKDAIFWYERSFDESTQDITAETDEEQKRWDEIALIGIMTKLGDCFSQENDKDNAKVWYQKVIDKIYQCKKTYPNDNNSFFKTEEIERLSKLIK